MANQVRNLAEYYLENDTPEAYIQYWHDTKTVFNNLFNQYYQKFVLDKPTLEERWNAYAFTPVEWLHQNRWLEHFIAKVEVDGEIRDCDLTHNMVAGNYDRGHEFSRDYLVEHIDELVSELEEGRTETYSLNYAYQKPRTKIPLAIDIIDQWKEQLILRKVGSFRNDW